MKKAQKQLRKKEVDQVLKIKKISKVAPVVRQAKNGYITPW